MMKSSIYSSCSFWPHGVPALPRPCRDEATKMRTRVAAKMSLLSLFSGTIAVIRNIFCFECYVLYRLSQMKSNIS